MRHMLPVFGSRKLSEVSPLDLENFFLGLYSGGKFAGSTVNNILKATRALFKGAERLGLINDSPARRVARFADKGLERRALTEEELGKLFALNALDKVWIGAKMAPFTAPTWPTMEVR